MSHFYDFSRRKQLQKLSLQHSELTHRPTVMHAILKEQRKLTTTIKEIDLDKRHSLSHMDSEIELFRKMRQEAYGSTNEDDKMSIISEAGSETLDVEDNSRQDINKSKNTDIKYRVHGKPIHCKPFENVKNAFTNHLNEFEDGSKKSSETTLSLHKGNRHPEKSSTVNMHRQKTEDRAHKDRVVRRCASLPGETKKDITVIKNTPQTRSLNSSEVHQNCSSKTDRQLCAISGTNNRESFMKDHRSHEACFALKKSRMECRARTQTVAPSSPHTNSAIQNSFPFHSTFPEGTSVPLERRRAFTTRHSNIPRSMSLSSFPQRYSTEHSRLSLTTNPMIFHPRFNNFTGLHEDDYNSFQALRKCRYLRIPQKYLTAEIPSTTES